MAAKKGRPKLPDARRRGRAYTVKFTRAEDTKLRELCGLQPVAAYLRAKALTPDTPRR